MPDTTSILPHDPYITAVRGALAEAGFKPGDWFTDDSDTRGTYCYLRGVITLDPSDTASEWAEDIPAGTSWPHGLLLIWEWHTGIEADQGEPDRGPAWKFAALKNDGSSEYPTDLPVYGYAAPAAVVDATRKVINHEIKADSPAASGQWRGWTSGLIGHTWTDNDALDAACETWAKTETDEEAR